MTFINAFIFFFIALVYSSAGFGGGSMYLAMLSQVSNSEAVIRFTGLSCNAIVTATGTINFHIKKWLAWKQVLGLLLFSIPFCIWASTFKMSSSFYFITLGVCLLLAGLMMAFQKKNDEKITYKKITTAWWLFPASAIIGFLSGLTGIGGGVYLSPLLHLSSWGSAKHISAASSVFILVNSIAGMTVQYVYHGDRLPVESIWLLAAVLAGGLIGSRLSSSIFNQKIVKLITIILIIFAAVRILIRYI